MNALLAINAAIKEAKTTIEGFKTALVKVIKSSDAMEYTETEENKVVTFNADTIKINETELTEEKLQALLALVEN